ncbi:hypothetical protein CAC42_1977 [Sphaceloma murrayae]|uniref:Uncharacterized protein n=1 Tax=Sphaceloma murrayae TaxID=2082308 RepID=A0A2K1QHW8_9PEZI|nr:hypothetical protein CAC42_1977 [Sphaceloma murrayae]
MFEWMPGGRSFDLRTDIPDLSGKVILVTGGNTGLGKEAIRRLVRHNPKAVWLACRTESKGRATIDEIKKETPDANVEYLDLDLSVMALPFSLTPQNHEIQLGTNHLGHALLTKLLLPILLRTAENSPDVRIVNLSSEGHHFAALSHGLVLDPTVAEKKYAFTRYGTSKLANLLHARALRKRYPQLTVTSCHPGVIWTQLYAPQQEQWRGTPILGFIWGMLDKLLGTVEAGVKNQIWCAVGPREDVRTGFYFTPVGRKSGWGMYTSETEAEKLWAWTEAELAKSGFE